MSQGVWAGRLRRRRTDTPLARTVANSSESENEAVVASSLSQRLADTLRGSSSADGAAGCPICACPEAGRGIHVLGCTQGPLDLLPGASPITPPPPTAAQAVYQASNTEPAASEPAASDVSSCAYTDSEEEPALEPALAQDVAVPSSEEELPLENGAETPEQFVVRCCLCGAWRRVTEADYEYYSDIEVPFVCRCLGLRCRTAEEANTEEDREEETLQPPGRGKGTGRGRARGGRGQAEAREAGQADVAVCQCPGAAQDVHQFPCPLAVEALNRLVQSESRAGGRGRRARGGRGKGRGKGQGSNAEGEPPTQREGTLPSQAQRLTLAHWVQLDQVTLADHFKKRVRTLENVPRAFRGRFRSALLSTLDRIAEAEEEGQPVLLERAWKLWCLLPKMLLRVPQGSGKEGRKELQNRFAMFWAGEWLQLLEEEEETGRPPREDTLQRRLQTATKKVKLGEASRGAQTLTAGKLAPGTPATLAELTDCTKRPRTAARALPPEVRNFVPASPVVLDEKLFLSALRAAPKGSSASLTGLRYEHLKVALDNERVSEALLSAARLYAQAKVPAEVAKLLRTGTLTALLKPNGKVRGIVAGDSLRRLVARTLSKQFGPEMEAACAPYQYALSTRAGTECVSHLLRAAVEADPRNTVLSVDGIGAYDTISRLAMLEKLSKLPKASAMLPFVLLSYGVPSEYFWFDDTGQAHLVPQGDGGEQGDPLMPALFSLGQHGALEAIAADLLPTERVCAFLDDIYVMCRPERVKDVYGIVERHLYTHTGIRLNQGKTKVYNKGGLKPAGVEDLQPQGADAERVWVGDHALPREDQGVVVLGSPVGTPEFAEKHGAKKLEEAVNLMDLVAQVPDLQCAWVLLSLCCATRANYHLRSQPPAQVELFAASHDAAIWETLCKLLQRDDLAQQLDCREARVATLPQRLGGCGLRSALRTSPAAYWASWADTLPMMRARNPDLAAEYFAQLKGEVPPTECLRAVTEAQVTLDNAGFVMPAWDSVWNGARPEPVTESEPGEWRHGWQYFAAAQLEKTYRASAVMSDGSLAAKALLRSQSGPGAGAHLSALPVDEARTLQPHHLRLILLRRLRMPLPLDVRRCSCGGTLDPYGDHRSACATVGKLARRAVPLERAWARVCREAGARVQQNTLLREFNLNSDVTDARKLEVLADNLPLWNGAQLGVDATLVSPVRSNGLAYPRAAVENGVRLEAARRRKVNKYPELLHSRRCRLVVAAMEIGGRWSEEAWTFLALLAKVKAETAPAALRRSTEFCFLRRWSTMIAVAAQTAYAASLLGEPAGKAPAPNDQLPELGEALEDRCVPAEGVSKLR